MNFELTEAQIDALSAKFSPEEVQTAISVLSEVAPEQENGKYVWDQLKREMQNSGQLPADDLGQKVDKILENLNF
jgi:hypothetical protein